MFLIKNTEALGYSRSHTILYIVLGCIFLSLFRVLFFRKFYLRLNENKIIFRNVLAVGAGSTGHALATHINDNPQLGLSIAGFIDDDLNKIGKQLLSKLIYGPIENVKNVLNQISVNEIYIAINSIQYSRLLEIIEICRLTDIPVTVITPHFRIVHDKLDISEFSTIDSFTFNSNSNEVSLPTSWFIKRSIDFIGSLLIILILSPIFISIAIAVKFTSEGKIFYKSDVVGKDGKLFTWYKFRTMYQNNDPKIHQDHLEKIIKENGTTEKIKDDPRITKVGKILRKFSLDEFPQLLNVIKGQMSLIGPRPCLKYEYDHFDDWHKERFKIKPGMTGMWQVFGRNNSDVTFNDSIIMDLYYIHNYSLWLDFKIVLKTIPTVLFGKGGV